MAEQGKTPHPTWASSCLWQTRTSGKQQLLAEHGQCVPPEWQVSQSWQAIWAGSRPWRVTATQSDLRGGETQTPPGQLGCGSGCASGSFRGCGVGCEKGTCRAEASLP